MTNRQRLSAAMQTRIPKQVTITVSAAGLIALATAFARAMGPMVVTPERFAHDSSRRETRYVVDSVKQLGRDSLLHRDISDVAAKVDAIQADVRCLRHPRRRGCE